MTDKRKTFHNETPKTSDCVLCHYCGDLLHAPEDDIFWEQTTNHLCSPMLKATVVDLKRKLDMVAAYLKDMAKRGDDEAKALLDMLDIDEDEPDAC
jgi:hypothetical protein